MKVARGCMTAIGGFVVIIIVVVIIVAVAGGSHSSTPTNFRQTQTSAAVSHHKQAKSKPTKPSMTGAQSNAVEAAKQYLDTEAFSEAGLIQQLSSQDGDGYPLAIATFAVHYLHVDWNAEAIQDAKTYLQTQPFSCAGLTQQLAASAGEGFTHAQAQYGADHTSACSGS